MIKEHLSSFPTPLTCFFS